MWSLINVSATRAGKAENPQYICPKGYMLIGENCRSIHQVDLVPYCGNDSDAQLVDGMCIVEEKLITTCEFGEFFPEDDMCYDTAIVSPQISCPQGYNLVATTKKGNNHGDDKKKLEGYCEKPVPLAGPQVCPWGTVPEGKRCASYNKVTPFWSCPPGTQPNGQFCTYDEEYDCSQPVVPIAKKGDKKKRMLGEEKDFVVEAGLDGLFWSPEIVHIGRKCVRQSHIPAVMQCPAGSAQEGTDCISVAYYELEEGKPTVTYETAPVSPHCPAEYDFCETKKYGQMCCKDIESKPWRQCRTGFVRDGGHCIRRFEPVYICPVDKKLRKGSACEGYDWQPATAMVTMYVEEGHKKKYDVVAEHHHGKE